MTCTIQSDQPGSRPGLVLVSKCEKQRSPPAPPRRRCVSYFPRHREHWIWTLEPPLAGLILGWLVEVWNLIQSAECRVQWMTTSTLHERPTNYTDVPQCLIAPARISWIDDIACNDPWRTSVHTCRASRSPFEQGAAWKRARSIAARAEEGSEPRGRRAEGKGGILDPTVVESRHEEE